MNTTRKYFVPLLIMYLVVEAMSAIGLQALKLSKGIEYQAIGKLTLQQKELIKKLLSAQDNYYQLHSKRGWSIAQNSSNTMYRSNSQGLRSDREYPLANNALLRIAAFGDSFTHADDVANQHTWAQQIEASNRGVEVLNFGVSAYGPGQALLRYLDEGRQFSSDVVLIGYMSENLYRSVNTFRPFYSPQTQFPLAKPRYIAKQGSLELQPNPLAELSLYARLLNDDSSVYQRLRQHDYFAQRGYHASALDFSPLVRFSKLLIHTVNYKFNLAASEIVVNGAYNPSSDAYAVSSNILKTFAAQVSRDGSKPIVVVFPTKDDLLSYQQNGTTIYAPLLDFFRANEIDFIDLVTPLAELKQQQPDLDLYKTHFTEAGNKVVAQHLMAALRARINQTQFETNRMQRATDG